MAGGVKSIFQSSSQNSVISKDQVQILRNWNNAVAHGCTNQETFNRIIANADDNTKMYFAGLNKGKGSIEGLKNAQNVAKQSTIGLTIAQTALNMAISMGLMAAISLAIKGFDKLVNSAKRASEAADEAFSDTNEKVQQNEEEAKSLDELISKYKELKESGNLDIDGRKEVKELQNDIADLVGTQAKNLNLVNGKLDDEIKKLDEISAKEAKNAYETATANYNNSKKAKEKATGDESFLFVDGYAYTGKREKEAEEVLKNAGFGNNVQSGGFFGDTLFVMDSFDNNYKELKGAQEKADYLQSMIDVLEQNGQRATDLYAGLIKQRDAYLKYIDNQQNAANSLVNSWITYSQFSNEELSKINVDSVESFDTYRQKMIEEAKNDESIGKILADGILSDEDLEKTVTDFMATSLDFSKWYEQWLGNVQGSTLNETNTISFEKSWNDILKKHPDTAKKLKEAFKSGELTKDVIESTEEYNQLLKETGLSATQLMNKLSNMYNQNLKGINSVKSGLDSLFDKYEANEGYLKDEEVAEILAENPEYIIYLTKIGDKYKLNQEALDHWNESVKQQKEQINDMMGSNDYLSNYTDILDDIKRRTSHTMSGIPRGSDEVMSKTGSAGVSSYLASVSTDTSLPDYSNLNTQLDSLIDKNKELNTALLNNEITTTEYFASISREITSSGLEDYLSGLNGKFDETTDYIEEVTSALSVELSDALLQSNKRFVKGDISVTEYMADLMAGSKAQAKLLKSTYGLTVGTDGYAESVDEADESTKKAIESYNDLVDAQNEMSDATGFVNILTENADFLSSYTDEAGRLMDTIMDDNRLSNYVSSLSQELVDFANSNDEAMQSVTQALMDTANISAIQASEIIAQGASAVETTVGGSLSALEGMTSFAMGEVGDSITNGSTAIGNVLTGLGDAISNFEYSITATPKITGKFGISRDENGIPNGLELPSFGFDIKGSGGASVSNLASALSNAGNYFTQAGNEQANNRARDIDSYKKSGTGNGSKESPYRPTYKPKSSGGGGSSSSKEFSEEIDWIETAIARIEREITNLNNIVDATYKDWSTRNCALSSELSSITKEISLQQQAYNKYMSLANSVGLDSNYQELVKNGAIDYTTITDEDLADKIKQFKDFYEKALDCQDAVINLQGNIADLADQKISNITSEFDQLVEQLTHDINTIDKAMSLEEAKGRMGSGQYYTAQSNIIAQQQDLLLQERANISSAMKEALSQGISVNSEQYRNWMSQLDDIDEQLQDNEVTIAENTKAIREINDSWFEYQQSLIDSVISEVSFVKDMLDYKTLFNDNGSFTKEGWASISMSGTNYDIAMAKADEYGKRYTAYKELSKQDPLNKDIEKLMQEALSNQQEALKEAMGYYDDIKSMVQNSLDKMIEHLQELSDNYIEGLNLQKDMYDYQKTINEQTKTIGDLRKQIAAYSGDGSEETRATLQSLYNQLKESEKQLQETEYDKWLSDQQTMLDNMMDMAQEWEATYLESFENYLSPWLEEINAHGSEIAAALTDGGTVGIGMSNISNAITDNGNGVISSVDSANNSITNSVNTANEGISGTITIANRGILDALGYSVSDNLKSVIDSFRSNSSTLVSYDPDAKSGLGTLNTTLGNGLTDLKDNSGISKLSGIGALIEAIKLKVVDEKKQVEATATKTTTAVTNPTTTTPKPTPQPAPTPAPTPQPSSPQGNGQVDQGDKVKIVSGRFYNSSDGKTPTGNSKGQWNGKEVYITKVKNGAKYPYHVSTGTKLGSGDLGWLKKEQISGYKIGGQNIKDEFAWTQENGGEIIRRSDGAILTPVKGATVFNAQQTDALWNLSKSLIGNSGNLANTNIPDMVLKNGNQTINNDVRMDITLPNVTNYDEFVTQLKADSKFEKFVQSITFGNALGKNTLNKRRY